MLRKYQGKESPHHLKEALISLCSFLSLSLYMDAFIWYYWSSFGNDSRDRSSLHIAFPLLTSISAVLRAGLGVVPTHTGEHVHPGSWSLAPSVGEHTHQGFPAGQAAAHTAPALPMFVNEKTEATQGK